ncbi:ExeA family protein [Profundibacter sp.]
MNSTLDIYTTFFKLKERPFALVPDPDFIFWSETHKRAFAMLEYGLVTRAPITLITGEVGAGKTTLLQHLMRSVGDEVQIALLSNATGERGDLLRWVLLALNQKTAREETYIELFERFQAFLIAEYAAGRRVAIIIDEAQSLTREGLEELRMFTNINNGKDELLQLILVGQPELRDIVRRPDMTQFAQRVSSAFHLPAMTEQMVRSYITHRLQVAGGDPKIFSLSAQDQIYQETGGVPRLINQLCDLSMVYAYNKESQRVTRLIVQQVINDGVFFGVKSTQPASVLFLRNVSEINSE